MRIDTNTSPITPGAGRRYSYTYGDWGRTTALNDPSGAEALRRQVGVPSSSFYTLTVSGVPPTPRGITAYNGRACLQMTSNAVGNGYTIIPNFGGINRPLTMPFQEVKGPANLSGVDDFACWSVSAILAYDAIPGAVTGDLGLTVGPGTATTIKVSTFPGIQFGPSDVGVLSLYVRQTNGGAATYNQPVSVQPDLTQFNRYEIRIVGPTSTAEAQIKCFLNNVLVAQLAYGAGTLLPSQRFAVASNMGFTPGLVNRDAVPGSTVRMYVPYYGLVVCAAPTEAMLSGTTNQ